MGKDEGGKKLESIVGARKRCLKWLMKASGENVDDWVRVSHGDIICFILNRFVPGIINYKAITDGVDTFARATNWRLAAQAMRTISIGFNYDEVKLIMADEEELFRVVMALRRWETRFMEEPLEPLSPDEWNDDIIPPWFSQQAAKALEEKKLAAGESTSKKQRQVQATETLRAKLKRERVPISELMRGNEKGQFFS